MTEIQILINNLNQMCNINMAPLQNQQEALTARLVIENETIADREKIIECVATKLLASEAQLNRIMLIGDKMKEALNIAAHHNGLTEEEWQQRINANSEDIRNLIDHQYTISTELEAKVEKINEISDQQFSIRETIEKDLAMVTEWLNVIERIADCANIANLIYQKGEMNVEHKGSVLRCFTNRRHDLDVVIYLPQMSIDEHYCRVERMKGNKSDMERETSKLNGLREQLNRIQALGEKMTGWIGLCFPVGDEVQQKEHDLDMEAIIEPLKEKIDFSLGKIQKFENSQKKWENLISKNEYRIDQFQQVIEQLEEVRRLMDDIVDKLEEDYGEDVD
jgi:hypothetical protein